MTGFFFFISAVLQSLLSDRFPISQKCSRERISIFSFFCVCDFYGTGKTVAWDGAQIKCYFSVFSYWSAEGSIDWLMLMCQNNLPKNEGYNVCFDIAKLPFTPLYQGWPILKISFFEIWNQIELEIFKFSSQYLLVSLLSKSDRPSSLASNLLPFVSSCCYIFSSIITILVYRYS